MVGRTRAQPEWDIIDKIECAPSVGHPDHWKPAASCSICAPGSSLMQPRELHAGEPGCVQDWRVELTADLTEALCLGLAQLLLRLQLAAEGGSGVAGVAGTAVGPPPSAALTRELVAATAGATVMHAQRMTATA